ncbi:glucans biosynthesis glucosyltransferase H [Striga asiatica]|uniref:Glucans biosynthesis glucosyltransferase H n=1 Tax=Striga asiatica TaxID=4170 RepID=A0A5A7R6B7_STRAF|nr:glucans biosynthesis glucosyltransferase H [Striga asiatica]
MPRRIWWRDIRVRRASIMAPRRSWISATASMTGPRPWSCMAWWSGLSGTSFAIKLSMASALPVVGLHLYPKPLELSHHLLDIVTELRNHRGPSIIVRRARPASCDPPLGRIGPDKPIILFLDDVVKVGVDLVSKLLHGGRILRDFYVLVRLMHLTVQLIHALHVLFHIVHFLGEHLHTVRAGPHAARLDVGGRFSGIFDVNLERAVKRATWIEIHLNDLTRIFVFLREGKLLMELDSLIYGK